MQRRKETCTRRVHGWYDSLITDNGYRQIAALAGRFQDVPIDAVYSSDLFRTRTTAGAIWKPRALALHTRSDLREIGVGAWEDRTWGIWSGTTHRNCSASTIAPRSSGWRGRRPSIRCKRA